MRTRVERRYEVLVDDPRRGPYISPEQLHEDYIAMLAILVERIVADQAETVVFLDKSARPLAWFLRRFWADIGPQPGELDGQAAAVGPIPEIKFVRIDRLPWRVAPRLSFEEGGVRPITQHEVDGLRGIFDVGRINVLDGKRILIVDEQSETGDTLTIARQLFQKAFPSSSITATAWVTSTIAGGRREVRKIPAWYPIEGNWTANEDQTGRGVFDPVLYAPDAPAHLPRFGRHSYPFLCVPAPRDPRSRQLRREIRQLHDDFHAGVIWPRISTDRVEIRGMPADDYGRQSTEIRASRRY